MRAATTVFEHNPVERKDWIHADFVALARLNDRFKSPVLLDVIHHGNRTIKATQHVGVIRLRNHTIQVLPKIYRTTKLAGGESAKVPDELPRTEEELRKLQAREATYNLLHMLAYASDLPIREHDVAPLLSRDDRFFEILIHFFATHLMQEWQRGVVRGYVVIEDELPMLRGKWRLTDQLRRPERKHLFAVAYDEFTADNPLNRVFRFVIERLWHLTRDARNRQTLGELRQWLEEVTLLPQVRAADADPTRILTRMNERYRPLLNLARLFLDGGSLQLATGDLSTFAFVFNMNDLFEAFIVGFIRKHREEVLPDELKDCELLPQTRGWTQHLATREDKGKVFLLKPDLAFRKSDGTFPLLLDAKYKTLDPESRRLGVAPDDFYQMFAYSQRYRCPRVVMVYPRTSGTPAHVGQFEIDDSHDVISAGTVDMCVSLSNHEGIGKLRESLRELLRGATPWN